ARPREPGPNRRGRLADRLDQPRRRAPLDEIDEQHPATRHLHILMANNALDGVIAALDQYIGLQPPDQLDRGLLVKADDGIDRLDRGDDGGAVFEPVDRPLGSLEPAHAPVGIERDDQAVAFGARRRQQRDMSGMQYIEAAIREADAEAAAV